MVFKTNSYLGAYVCHWSEIPTLTSFRQSLSEEEHQLLQKGPQTRSGAKSKCHVLWLRGLDAFSELFENDEGILANLNLILSARRSFFNSVEFPEIAVPAILQTTPEGAEFLSEFGCSWASPNLKFLTNYPRRLVAPDSFKQAVQRSTELHLPSTAFVDRERFGVSGNVEVDETHLQIDNAAQSASLDQEKSRILRSINRNIEFI